MEKFKQYKQATKKIPEKHQNWSLYGSGLGNLGHSGEPVLADLPLFDDHELLARIDAVSLCYIDLKEIKQGDKHPRLLDRDFRNNPIVPGHEVSMTIVSVGKELQDQYKIGDRYTLQPDVWVDGKSIPFCFGLDGGYRQYAKIGKEILRGDAENYLIPISDDMTYEATAITEPWACVEAAYRMKYRRTLKKGGVVLLLGQKDRNGIYRLDEHWFSKALPKKVHYSGVSKEMGESIIDLCQKFDMPAREINNETVWKSTTLHDDLILLNCEPPVINDAQNLMNKEAVIALINTKGNAAQINIDLCRLNYDGIIYVGTESDEISTAYISTKAHTEMKENGICWILGAGGPMGRMHLQRAIEKAQGSKTILATEVNEKGYSALCYFFIPLAKQHKKRLLISNPSKDDNEFNQIMSELLSEGGIDDIEVMVTVPELVTQACDYLAEEGVVNLFAGMKRGVKTSVNLNLITDEKQIRFIGHSGSRLDDQKVVVEQAINGNLKPELSVAAVGGFKQILDGIRAMEKNVFPGKIVIYPHVPDFPLTALGSLKEVLPKVYAALGLNNICTLEDEEKFLEKELI